MQGSSEMTAETSSQSVIGRPVRRKEDERLLRGQACFLDDVPEPAGTLSLGFVRSPYAHALIGAINAEDALKLDGVVAVICGSDLDTILPSPIQPDLPLPGFTLTWRDYICRDRVRYVGDIVAAVLASDPYVLEDAIELIEVDYEPLPVLATAAAATAPDAPEIHEGVKGNLVFKNSFKTENFDEVFASADHVVKEMFRTERVAIVSMEARGCLGVYDPGLRSLNFWTSTQIPHMVRTALAEALDLDENRVRVICPDTGGGFGMKTNVYPEEFITAALAVKYRTGIKWVQDRQDDFLTSTHARDFHYGVEIAYTNEGIMLAARLDVTVNIGAYPSFPFGSSLESGGGPRTFPGPYKFSNYAFETRSVLTHTSPTSAFRGVSAPVSFFCLEGMMDRIARRLDLDPAEIRRRNLVRKEDFPYKNVNGIRYDTGTYVECLDRAIERSGYHDFRNKRTGSRLTDGKYRGVGIAVITEQSGQGGARYRARGLLRIPGVDSAEVRVEPSGKATVAVSHTTQGQGHLTTFAQIAAEHLGLKVEDVTVIEGDTALTPFGTGTFASRGVVTGGGAVIRASDVVAAKIRRIAANELGVEPEEIQLAGGYAMVASPALNADLSNRRISIEDISRIAHSMSLRTLPEGETHGLIATEFYDPPVPAVSNAAHICFVAVDPKTGRVDVERYIIAHDCGRVINPMVVEGQIHGAVAQGLGPALMEQIIYDEEGQLLTTTLLDYVVPSASCLPEIELDHFETLALDTLGGVKGMGEGGTIGAIPAIANAVSDALADMKIEINHIPIRPDSVLRLIQDAEKSGRL